jgi:hypothetical protein
MRNPKAVPPVATIAAPPHPSTSGAPPPATKSSSAPAPSTPVELTPAPVAAPIAPPPAPAQAVATPSAPSAPVHINTVQIPDGKPFNITLAQDVPAKLTAGQKLNFVITHDVKIGDIVVIAKGTPVAGEVVDPGDSKKTLGIIKTQGKATFKLSNVESAGGSRLGIRTTPAHTDKGDRSIELQGTKTKDLLAPAGTEYMSYIDNEQTVSIKH